MHDDLKDAVRREFPKIRSDLEALVSVPSVSAPGFDRSQVHHGAALTAELMLSAGLDDVQLLEVDHALPAVYGEVMVDPDAPTVLLYAHHDVQPPGPEDEWDTPPFEPVERGGRLYGRGAADDKGGIAVHLGAIRAHGAAPPVNVKVFVEGEEEIGSLHLTSFLEAHRERLAADVIVIADVENWRTGTPSLTTSLRGLVDCVIELRTLEHAVHSGSYGGALPDAVTCLVKALATLHDDDGEVAVEGLVRHDAPPLDLTEDELRLQAGALLGTRLIGSGTLTSRIWTKPAISVVGMDVPPVAEAINQLVPVARAKVSMRIAPGEDPQRAMAALANHLRDHVPFGASVTIDEGAAGSPISLDTAGPAYDAFRHAFKEAWGTDAVEIGAGGSIPFVAEFAELYPEASILLTGVADPASRIHGPNESVDLGELERATVAEAIALRLLSG